MCLGKHWTLVTMSLKLSSTTDMAEAFVLIHEIREEVTKLEFPPDEQ